MLYIAADKRNLFDSAIKTTLQALREAECDFDDKDYESNVGYLILTLLKSTHSGDFSSDDIIRALGVLETVKLEYMRTIGVPVAKQQQYDNE